jgi:hypothetical protein
VRLGYELDPSIGFAHRDCRHCPVRLGYELDPETAIVLADAERC